MPDLKRTIQNRLNKQYQRITEKIKNTIDTGIRKALEATRNNLDTLRQELRGIKKTETDKLNDILLDYQENAAYSADPKKAAEYMEDTMAFQEFELEVEDAETEAERFLSVPLWMVSDIYKEWEEVKYTYYGPSANAEDRQKALSLLDKVKDALKNHSNDLTPDDINRLNQIAMEIEEGLNRRGRKTGTRNRYKAHRRTKAEMGK